MKTTTTFFRRSLFAQPISQLSKHSAASSLSQIHRFSLINRNINSNMATSSAQASPQNNKLTPIWTLSAQEIRDQTKQLIDQTRAEYDRIAKLSSDECSFQSVV